MRSRGINSTSPITSTAPAAGTAVSSNDFSGPNSPSAIDVPITATAAKLTELLIRKNATDRRAMRSVGMPPACRIQPPSASPAAPLAGTIEPIPSVDHAISQLVRNGMWLQKIGRNIRTYEMPDINSRPTPSAIQAGLAPSSLARTSPSPGARKTMSTSTPRMAITWSARRASSRGSNSRGITTGAGPDTGRAVNRVLTGLGAGLGAGLGVESA